MATWFDEHIAHYPGVQGGAAVIGGTRTPVSTIVAMYPAYGSDVPNIVEALPHLTETDVRAALAYYEEHRTEIDADIERHARILDALVAASV
jgi:uncharacterized protein (DUF433 family)